MWIDGRSQTLLGIAHISTPALPVAHEEALLGSQAIDWFQLLAFSVFLPRHVSQDQATYISYIFAKRQLAVDFHVINDFVVRILIGDATSPLYKILGIFGSPPVAQIAFGVVLAAFIIEAMRQFV